MQNILIRQSAVCEYSHIYRKMVEFTDHRTKDTADEIWLLQHQPVFTLGLGGKTEHVLDAGSIPVIRTDRGGQVTYHGPGQLLVYLMLDLKRRNITVKQLIHQLEQSVINFCNDINIDARRRQGAPGVYVSDQKLAALGIRVRRGCSYHGLALNVDMSLDPFRQINPCGFPGLQVTRLMDLGYDKTVYQTGELLLPHLLKQLDIENDELQDMKVINETRLKDVAA